MVTREFVDRTEELAALEERYARGSAELFVVYGRRRLGKTALLRQFCAGKPHLFFVATLASAEAQLARFSAQLLDLLGLPAGLAPFSSWEAAFEQLATVQVHPVVVIDEFTYLTAGDPAIPSMLQRLWDERLRNSTVFLVLCGSYVGMMERETMVYSAPLYGRRTGAWLLGPLALPAAAQFVPRYDSVAAIETWAVVGGIPYYLEAFDDQRTVLENAARCILDPRALLHSEPRLLLMEELREPRNYFSVLQAIAHGCTRLNAIAQAARLAPATVGKYLDVLRGLGIIERRVPITETRPEKSRQSIYRLYDPFLRFWFRFVHPFQDRLELGMLEAVMGQEVAPHFDSFVGQAFEDAAQAYVATAARRGQLPISPTRLGRWWSNGSEIDLVGIDDGRREIIVGECKWSERPVGPDVLDDLLAKASYVPGGPWRRIVPILFAKRGFTPDLVARATAGEVLLVTPDDMIDQGR